MKLFANLILAAGGLSLLGACSSSNDNGSTTRVLAEDAGTAIQALDSGETLTAQEGANSSLQVDYATGETSFRDTDFQIRKNADGEMTFLVDGVEQAFVAGDRSDDYTYNDGTTYLWSASGTLADAIDDPDAPNYSQVWGYYTRALTEDGNGDTHGYAVVGTETSSDALADMPAATYSGRGRIDALPATGYVNNDTSRTRINGSVGLTADFGAATISGLINDVTVVRPGAAETGVAGTATMMETSIEGNGFSGAIEADSTLQTNLGLGASGSTTYSGRFYGEAAEEASGTISMDATLDGSAHNGAGFFRTTKDTP
ncbi:hypothetical protein E0K89_021135 [Aquicoccus sp. SCR17]|nr:hypothetical protein [Carideicomes alvinocaridis]